MWIEMVTPEKSADVADALQKVRPLFPTEYGTPVHLSQQGAPGILMSHSLIPKALEHSFSLIGTLLSPNLPLTREQQEMIAVVVSSKNHCQYCSTSHSEFLRRVSGSDTLVYAVTHEHRVASISMQDRVMLDYAVKMTRDASKITRDDHARLREVGFSEEAVLQITLIAAYFNYINRVADALGVGRDEEQILAPATH